MTDSSGSTSQERDRKRLIVAGTVAAIVFILMLCIWSYSRGGGPTPTWYPFGKAPDEAIALSDPQEVVLRSVRLAGFERAVVGEEADVAVLRLEIPAVSSAADVEVAWQAGIASLVEGYPKSEKYVIQIFEGEQALVEVAWAGAKARPAVEAGNSGALKAEASFVFLVEVGEDE